MRVWILSIISIATTIFAAKLELHDGRLIETDIVEFNGKYFMTQQDTLPRGDIKEIIFSANAAQETGAINTGQDVKEILAVAKKAIKRFPNAKGILLIDDGKNTLYDDGTRSYSYHMAYMIQSESRKNIATFRGYFREGDNEIKIHFARVIKPNGKVVNLDLATVKVETPPREDVVFFGKGKWLTFTIPGVEVGDILEYSYENIRYNPWNKEIFEAGYNFQGEDPFVWSRFTIDLPEDEFLHWKTYNMPKEISKPKVSTVNGRKIYVWETRNVTPYVPEPNSPPTGEFTMHLETTNQKNWNTIHDWYKAFQDERLKVTPEIQELSDNLTARAEDNHDKIAAIYHWIQQNIRYISIKGSASSGVSGHPAQFTLEQGFGDCTDKANLFATMLRSQGIDADPVYVGTNNEIPLLDPEIPGYYGNHCITEVFLADTNFYLDATGSSNGGFSRYPAFNSADHGVYAVNSQKRKVEIIPVPTVEQQLREYNLDMEIDDKGNLDVEYQSFYVGDYETGLRYFWNYLSREEDRRMRFEQMVKSESPDAELIDYELVNLEDLDKQLSLKIHYRIPNYVTFADPIVIINLPEARRRLVFDEVSLEKRTLPLTYYSSEGIKHNFTLKLPSSWTVDYLPEPIELKLPEVSYKGTYTLGPNNVISFHDFYARRVRIIQPGAYSTYRKTLNLITNYHKKPILVIREGGR